MLLSIRIALRYIFSKKKQSFSNYASFLSIGGVSIGITSLMLTASIINGFEEIVSKKLSSFLGYGRITNIFNRPINIESDSVNSLKKQISDFEPFIQDFSIIRFGGKADGILVEGVNNLPKSIIDYNSKLNVGEIVLGFGLSNLINCKINDIIYLQSHDPKSVNLVNKIFPFKVVHVFKSGIQEYDKLIGYVNIDDARSVFNFKKNYVTGFIVNNKPNFNLINEISYPFYFESWKEKHSLLFEWINIQRFPAYIMFGLIALVGLINVLAALTMIIIEKSSQIGILISQGMKKKQLKYIFIIQGAIIGLIGGCLGGAISMIIISIQKKYKLLKIPSDIYFMDEIPFSFDYFSFGLILIIIFIFCIISSLWPTKVAMNINPSKVLKYE